MFSLFLSAHKIDKNYGGIFSISIFWGAMHPFLNLLPYQQRKEMVKTKQLDVILAIKMIVLFL